MAYKIIRTDAFQRDLDRAVGYIAVSLNNRIAAGSLLDAVEKCYNDLARMPLMYEACRDPYLRGLGYRRAVVHHCVIVYKIDEAGKTVQLLRFFHGRQDYERMI